jgi:hypothetical protein
VCIKCEENLKVRRVPYFILTFFSSGIGPDKIYKSPIPSLPRLKMPRTYAQELEFIERISPVEYIIKKGFVPNMNVSSLS